MRSRRVIPVSTRPAPARTNPRLMKKVERFRPNTLGEVRSAPVTGIKTVVPGGGGGKVFTVPGVLVTAGVCCEPWVGVAVGSPPGVGVPPPVMPVAVGVISSVTVGTGVSVATGVSVGTMDVGGVPGVSVTVGSGVLVAVGGTSVFVGLAVKVGVGGTSVFVGVGSGVWVAVGVGSMQLCAEAVRETVRSPMGQWSQETDTV